MESLSTYKRSFMADSSPTARRADARRNYEKILEAAREAFTGPDADASMAEIARRAGVGMATLYRNFPSRRELLEALYAQEVGSVCDAAASPECATPGAAFFAWLNRFACFFTNKRRVAAHLLEQSSESDPIFSDSRARVMAAGAPLLDAAQRSGEVRAELTLEQVLDLVIAVAGIPGNAGHREPILRAALDGLRPPVRARS